MTSPRTNARLLQQEDVNAVANSFDTVAPVFDVLLENEITRRLRTRIYSIVESLAEQGSSIIDINCGTGIDAIHLAAQGHRLTGIDVSPKMISEARKKTSATRSSNPKFFVDSFERISLNDIPAADLTFSNFGGLNCINNLSVVAGQVGAVTKPNGYFVGVIMPPFSLWEFTGFLLRGQFRQAVRRIKKSAPSTGFGSDSFRVYYHSPSEVERAFAPYFSLRSIIGLSVLSPTPQSIRFARSHKRLTRILCRIDRMIESIPLFRSIGDHYVIILQRGR